MTFLRRLSAFLVDAGVVLFLSSLCFAVWASFELGGLPETPAEYAAVIEVGQALMPNVAADVLLAYAVLSFTPMLGRRTIGMRQVGIRVVRDGVTRGS